MYKFSYYFSGTEGGGGKEGGLNPSDWDDGNGSPTYHLKNKDQQFFINRWTAGINQLRDRKDAKDVEYVEGYNEFVKLALVVSPDRGRKGTQSSTIVSLLYLVANINGENYDVTNKKNKSWWRIEETDDKQELVKAAKSFSNWAEEYDKTLIDILIEYLKNVTDNDKRNKSPEAIQKDI